MQKDEIAMKCLRCSRQHRVLDMVMDVSGRGMVCRECGGLAPKPGAKFTRPAAAAQEPSARERYTCQDCNFRFASSKGKLTTCGYCGSARVRPDKLNSAGRILQEASARRYD